jgi:integral membrane protein (TIGR00529 family)
MMVWIGFLLSFVTLLLLARRSFWLALILASVVLGIFSLSLDVLSGVLVATIIDPSILLLALSVGVIPMIGGILETKGQMDQLVDNLRIGRKQIMVLTPALLGMLPMPGGALLSAPLINRVGQEIDPARKVAINLWFRHILLLIYPLGPAIIASAKMANLEVYQAIPYLMPPFVFMTIAGYALLLTGTGGKIRYAKTFSLKELIVPVFIILLAPLLDFTLKRLGVFAIAEVALLIAVTASCLAALIFTRASRSDFKLAWTKMKPVKFSMIIIGVFLFLNVFKTTSIPVRISNFALSSSVLCVGVSLLLGFITGRTDAPASIVIPIYLASFAKDTMTAPVFAITYFSIFLGYLLSPIHPCLVVTLEYFNAHIGRFFRVIFVPAILTIIFIFILAQIYPAISLK